MADDGSRRPRGAYRPISPGGRYDTAPDEEAVAIGRALVARIRGEPLSPAEEALLARGRALAPGDRAPAPVVDVSETLATFERGADAELRVSWRRYKGSSPFLDIRRFERVPGEGMKPTKQGVTIRARELSRLMSLLVQVVRRVGLEADRVAEEDE